MSEDYSPEQIAGKLNKDGILDLHHETIYQYILSDKVNGKEFSKHEEISRTLECNTYFAAPYHSWERGQNENANGLLRQYFPKAIELIGILEKDVFDAVDKLNSRPKKCLNFKTPYEAFQEATGIDVRKIMSRALMT